MRCPKCKDLGIDGQYFCSQDCFRAAWETHKMLHTARKLMIEAALNARPLRVPSSFEGYRFTGALRPGAVSAQMRVPAHIVKPDYADTGRSPSEDAVRGSNIIPVYSGADIEHARRAGRIAREVLDIAAAALRPGVTGDDIDRIVFAACVERGVYPSPLNYLGFPKSVCVSSNEVICHGIPDARAVASGEIVNLDVTVYTPEGFHADLNETYLIGTVDARGRRLVKCAYECLQAALAACAPGVPYRELGAVISRVAARDGYSVVKSYCGHGVGKLFHCAPNVPHYAKNKAVGVMRVGHMFTVEPMINEGVCGDELWPDKWTVVTVDGKRSAQFEHTVVITETGCEILTARQGADRYALAWDDRAVERPLPDADVGAATSASATNTSSGASTAAADTA